MSCRDMIEALIAGERNPKALADLARGKMRAKRKALAEALDGRFEDHHAVEARILLRHIDGLTRDIEDLTARAGELITQIPAAWGIDADGTTGPAAGQEPDAIALPAVARLDEITGCGPVAAMAIIAEIGLDMTVFGTAGRLVSWARLCPQTRQSGKKATAASPGKGDPGSRGHTARSPPPPPAPTPSSASATAASPDGEASARPSPPSPAPSSSSSSTCSQTPPHGTATSDPATTTTAPPPNERSATTSASSRPSASPSPSHPLRTPPSPAAPSPQALASARPGPNAACPLKVVFTGQQRFSSPGHRQGHDLR
jgi:hypothetical protein